MTDNDDFKADLAYLNAMADLILTYPPNQLQTEPKPDLSWIEFVDGLGRTVEPPVALRLYLGARIPWPRDKAQTLLNRWRRDTNQ